MSNFGIPYMGSKSKICEKVCGLFPRAENFYDLFGGGFSITHFMVKHRSKHYNQFHFNEIRPGIIELIQDAINGKYNYNVYSPEWISRERFERDKDTDPLIKIIWSFGNNGKGYLFGKDIEDYKKSMHMAIVFNEFDDYAKEFFGMDSFKEGYSILDKRLLLRNRAREVHGESEKLQQLKQLQQLERLERLQQLERLENKIIYYNKSYQEVDMKNNSVVYCDIPYGDTADYDNNSSFNRRDFFNWAHELKEPVFISEYNVEDKRFKCVANIDKRSLLSSNRDNKLIKNEKVYVNHAGYIKLMSRSK